MGNQNQKDMLRLPSRYEAQAQAPTPGKVTNTMQLMPAQPGTLRSGIWGNDGALKAPSPYKMGNGYVDGGTGCDRPAGGTCFLDPAQRERLVPTYQSRVTAAQTQYMAALTQLRVDKLLEKDPEKSQWLFELFLDIISMATASTAIKVLRAMRAGDVAVAHLGDGAVAAMRQASEAELSLVVNLATGSARRMLPPPPAAAPTTERTSQIAYLDLLANQSAAVYESLREDVLSVADDAVLVVLFESFAASAGHTLQAYKDEITAKLSRFAKSHVGDIGVTQQWPDQEETKAFWVKLPIGRRLALYRREHHPISKSVMATRGWRDRSDDELASAQAADLEARPFVFSAYVPAELVDAALSMHQARWGTPPEHHAAGIHELAQMGANP